MPKRPFLLVFLLIASALALSACGGGGDSDESQIEEAVETVPTSTDPATCKKFQTQNLMEQGGESEGAAALKECEEEVTDDRADSVAVSNIEVDGSEASADAAITGGGFDGQTLEIELLKEGDQWQLNEVVGFAKFDQAALIESFNTGFEEQPDISEETIGCADELLEELSQSETEEYLLEGSSQEFGELIGQECS